MNNILFLSQYVIMSNTIIINENESDTYTHMRVYTQNIIRMFWNETELIISLCGLLLLTIDLVICIYTSLITDLDDIPCDKNKNNKNMYDIINLIILTILLTYLYMYGSIRFTVSLNKEIEKTQRNINTIRNVFTLWFISESFMITMPCILIAAIHEYFIEQCDGYNVKNSLFWNIGIIQIPVFIIFISTRIAYTCIQFNKFCNLKNPPLLEQLINNNL